jgi:uncharacterized protein (DUF2267 family)
MGLNVDEWAQEGNRFLKQLADDLGHPGHTDQAATILRAVLHSLRDRISISENLNLLSQLPMFMKAIYVENWTYSDSVDRIKHVDDFVAKVNDEASDFGLTNFAWKKPMPEVVGITLKAVRGYITEGEAEDVKANLPAEISRLFEAA